MSDSLRLPHETAVDLINEHFAGIEFEEYPVPGYAVETGASVVQFSRELVRPNKEGEWCKARLNDQVEAHIRTRTITKHITQLGLTELEAGGKVSTLYTLWHDSFYLSKGIMTHPVGPRRPSTPEELAARIVATVRSAVAEIKSGFDEASIEDWEKFLGNLAVGEWSQEEA